MAHTLVMGLTTVKCGCGKVVGLSLEDAKMQRRKFAKRHGGTNPVRYYRCQFGSWHWTSHVTPMFPGDENPEFLEDTPRPSKQQPFHHKPKGPNRPPVHYVHTVDWEAFEPSPGREHMPVVQHAKMRRGKWFYHTGDGAGGYADTLLEAVDKLAHLVPGCTLQ